jgi:hypothetical protein
MAGALVTAVLRARKEVGEIYLSDSEGEQSGNGNVGNIGFDGKGKHPGEASDNPLSGIDVPQKVLAIMFATSIVGSTVSAFIFVVSLSVRPTSRCLVDQLLQFVVAKN